MIYLFLYSYFVLVAGGWLGQAMVVFNHWLIKLSRSMFAYEIAAIVRPLPTTEHLLALSEQAGKIRVSGHTHGDS